jgi:hypothetical protein
MGKMENLPLQAGKDVIGKICISIRQVFARPGQG